MSINASDLGLVTGGKQVQPDDGNGTSSGEQIGSLGGESPFRNGSLGGETGGRLGGELGGETSSPGTGRNRR
jgi:hypothetical protein